MRDVARVEEEKHIEQSENSTQPNTVHLCPSATQGMLVGLLAAELFPTGFQFPAACYAVFYKAERTEGTGSLKLQRPAGLNSLLSISGYLKVFPPYYREENPNKDG